MTFFRRLKLQLMGEPLPEPPPRQVAVPELRRKPKGPEYTIGTGVDWEAYEQHRVMRLCACGRPHRRCDECAQFVCTQRPHHCPAARAAEGGGDEAA